MAGVMVEPLVSLLMMAGVRMIVTMVVLQTEMVMVRVRMRVMGVYDWARYLKPAALC